MLSRFECFEGFFAPYRDISVGTAECGMCLLTCIMVSFTPSFCTWHIVTTQVIGTGGPAESTTAQKAIEACSTHYWHTGNRGADTILQKDKLRETSHD